MKFSFKNNVFYFKIKGPKSHISIVIIVFRIVIIVFLLNKLNDSIAIVISIKFQNFEKKNSPLIHLNTYQNHSRLCRCKNIF